MRSPLIVLFGLAVWWPTWLVPLSSAFAEFGPTQQQMMEGLDAKTVQKLAQWTAVLEKNPKDFNALNQRGSLSLYAAHRSRYSVFWIYRAAKDLESATKLNPTDFYARHNYAQAAFEAGDWGDAQPNMHLAVIQFTKAIELNPKSARSHMGRGWAYMMLNDQSHADADFKKTRELDPSLQADLEKEAKGITEKKKQAVAARETLKRIGRYYVERAARTESECAKYRGLWTGSECRISTALNSTP